MAATEGPDCSDMGSTYSSAQANLGGHCFSYRSADLNVTAQRADPYRSTRVGRLDNQVVADGHLYVSRMREDEVARPDLRTGYRDPIVDLLICSAVQVNPRLRVGPLDQPRAVELVG